jgi:type II secretory pathway component HofQ
MTGRGASVLVGSLLLGGILGSVSVRAGEAEARVSLDLKEAPVTRIVELLVRLGGFQAVFDPGMDCKLTLNLHEVPWRTALDTSLRACQLGVDEEAGVLRIAPLAKLQQEASARQRLNEERRRTPVGKLQLFRLSYARAESMAPLLETLIGPKGRVSVDSRTNTLLVAY